MPIPSQIQLSPLLVSSRLYLVLGVALAYFSQAIVAQAAATQVDAAPQEVLQQDNTALQNTSPTPADLVFEPAVSESDALSKNLYMLLAAEFLLDRGQTQAATSLYESQAYTSRSAGVFERALSLALSDTEMPQGERALYLAHNWSQKNPAYVPAWFYVAHFALKTKDYELATNTLNKIVKYNPDADLETILAGITPDDSEAQNELLLALDRVQSQNPTLLLLKAGILQQQSNHSKALIMVNAALAQSPDLPAMIVLKARILNDIDPVASSAFITKERKRLKHKSLYLYQIRQLLSQKNSAQAFALLKEATKRFNEDNEVKLLASLVAIDLEEYGFAKKRLTELQKDFSYADQASFYLGIASERDGELGEAASYFASIEQDDLVLEAQRKLALIRFAQGQFDVAILGLERFASERPEFANKSALMQVELHLKSGNSLGARSLIERLLASPAASGGANGTPASAELRYAYTKLLTTSESQKKQRLLEQLVAENPEQATYALSLAQHYLQQEKNLTVAAELLEPKLAQAGLGAQQTLKAKELLGRIYVKQSRASDAAPLLLDVYQITPSFECGMALVQAFRALGDIQSAAAVEADLSKRFAEQMSHARGGLSQPKQMQE